MTKDYLLVSLDKRDQFLLTEDGDGYIATWKTRNGQTGRRRVSIEEAAEWYEYLLLERHWY